MAHEQPLAAGFLFPEARGFAVGGELSPSAAVRFARHSVELLAQALQEAPGISRRPRMPGALAPTFRACQVIALRFCQPALTPDLFARDMRISTRTLARMFAERGETVTRRVLTERVRRAAKLLASPRAASRSVTDIALSSCGLNDSSHFGPGFAAQLHVTPSGWRRRRSQVPRLSPLRDRRTARSPDRRMDHPAMTQGFGGCLLLLRSFEAKVEVHF